jgi:hypothetical protein
MKFPILLLLFLSACSTATIHNDSMYKCLVYPKSGGTMRLAISTQSLDNARKIANTVYSNFVAENNNISKEYEMSCQQEGQP